MSVLDVVVMGLYCKIGWCFLVMRKYKLKVFEVLECVGFVDYVKC